MVSNHASAFELAVRKTWSLGRISELLEAGRQGGWLPLAGDAPAVLDATKLLATYGEKLQSLATPMQRLAERCKLSPREVDALWLLTCIELEPRVTRALKLLLVDSGVAEMTVQLLERATYGEKTHPGGESFVERFCNLGLAECAIDSAVPLQRRTIRASDRVLELARGALDLDGAVRSFARLEYPVDHSGEVSHPLRDALASTTPTLVVITGMSEAARTDCFRAAMASSTRPAIVVRADGLAGDRIVASRQLRAIARECMLHGALPVIENYDRLGDRCELVEDTLLQTLDGAVVVTAGRAIEPPIDHPMLAVEATIPPVADRAEHWRRALPGATPELVAQCADTFRFPVTKIAQVGASVRCAAEATGTSIADVKAAVRADIEPKLSAVAKRVVVTQTWDDLVLPVEEFDLLLELCGRVRYRDQVLDEWGFADKVGRGTGITALMSGPPGTGKTMIAGLLANELGLDLYQIDLSKIVSKYIGETEKQLAAVFDAADAGHAVLLFDEADSLFGKRTEVKSSNDRYANLETNFLLQRIESFTGIAILTTNHESAIDPAFKRRLTTHIRVPAPERAQREELWKAMMPKQANVTGELDFSRLASEFEMSGGYIKNATLRAAFLAAAERKPISTAHLLRAARAEYQGMGRIALG